MQFTIPDEKLEAIKKNLGKAWESVEALSDFADSAPFDMGDLDISSGDISQSLRDLQDLLGIQFDDED